MPLAGQIYGGKRDSNTPFLMLKPTLQLKLSQTLTMTPQLQQAIRLLQLPVLDLSAQIQEALEENVMLEMEDLPDVPKTSAETTAEIEALKAEDNWQFSSIGQCLVQ